MKELLKRLTSRKFLLAVAAALVFYANGQWAELVAVILGYLGVEGGADIAGRFAQIKYVAPVQKQAELADSFFKQEDDDDVDKDQSPIPGM